MDTSFADGDAGGVDVYAGAGAEGMQHLNVGAHRFDILGGTCTVLTLPETSPLPRFAICRLCFQ